MYWSLTLITPFNLIIFSLSYHCQVISIQQFPEFSRYGLRDNHE